MRVGRDPRRHLAEAHSHAGGRTERLQLTRLHDERIIPDQSLITDQVLHVGKRILAASHHTAPIELRVVPGIC